jgi:hypothetical protein
VPRSFFSRITKYPIHLKSDPGENRLTEVTAATLQRSPAFALAFANHLLGDSYRWSGLREPGRRHLQRLEWLRSTLGSLREPKVDVETQVTTVGGRFVDLELTIRPGLGGGGGGLLIWVEVKDWADLHGDQLESYVAEIRSTAKARSLEPCVALLVPAGWATERSVPVEVAIAEWRGVGQAAAGSMKGLRDQVTRWLLGEYVAYLEEAHLSDPTPKPLTKFSADALMREDSTEESLVGIIERAMEGIELSWGPVRTDDDSRRPLESGMNPSEEFWAQFRPAPKGRKVSSAWGGSWFEFGCRSTREMVGDLVPNGDLAFMAGLTFCNRSEAARVRDAEEWLGRRVNDRYEFFSLDRYHRVARLLYPDELLARKSLDAQADLLSDWVVDAFASLADDSPPRPQ